MKKIFTFLIILQILAVDVFAQSANDSTKVLNEIVIKGYAYNRTVEEVPAAVAVVTQKDFERFNNTSLLPAVNVFPGVRMEERSPGSYRFSVRGSLLRSPFGVRNVKVYWNGLPFTDGGGNTYLNLLDFNAVGSMEIVKGPGGSLYGAGTGGVILLQSPSSKENQLQLSTVVGSYGLQRSHIAGEIHTQKTDGRIQASRQQAEGYREQTAMKRNGIHGDVSFHLSPSHTVSTTLLFTDLFYETPGGLNKAQYDANPKQARPPSALPGAVEQQASILNRTGYFGLADDVQWNDSWSTQTGMYGSVTSFENAAIRNYEFREERNFGIRTQTQYVFENSINGKISLGGEYQYIHSPVTLYGNNLGVVDTLQFDDKLRSNLLLFFAQAEIDLPHNFYLTVGASANFLKFKFIGLYPDATILNRNFDPVISPRVALLKKFDFVSLYASVSQGFSPPSLAEVKPSTGIYNNDLNAERGINYEVGFRGNLAGRQLQYDIAAYDFRLDETIVSQRTADNADYFINAGKTTQQGLEAMITWTPHLSATVITHFSMWSSYTYNHYRFKNYGVDGNDFSGNRITGVAPTVALWGVDLSLKSLYANITANYTDAIPLNDSNTEYASEYFLLGGRLGYRSSLNENFAFDIFAGIDNAFDKRYSLGNDLNAVGGRFYNAAAPRNFYMGVKFTPTLKKDN